MGAVTASTPTACHGMTEVETAVELLTLAAATDFIFIIPIFGRDNEFFVMKAEVA